MILELLDVLVRLEELQEANEPDETQHADHLDAGSVNVEKDELGGHRAGRVDPEPAGQVVACEPAARGDPLARLGVHRHRVEREEDVDDEDDRHPDLEVPHPSFGLGLEAHAERHHERRIEDAEEDQLLREKD